MRRRMSQWLEKDGAARESFLRELRAASSLEDAKALAARSPAADAPGRAFYSNLAFFLGARIVPAGASSDERLAYLALLRRAPDAIVIPADVRDRLERELSE